MGNAVAVTTDVLFDHNGEEQDQYLTFRLGDETFGIGILGIKEIIEYGEMTAVPMMPAFIHGVLNLRGRVVPVVDLAMRFGREATGIGRRTCVIIVELARENGTQDMGILVDAVNQVTEIPPQDIAEPPSFGATLRTDFISGMGRTDGQFVILLHIDRVLSLQDLSQISARTEQLQQAEAAEA